MTVWPRDRCEEMGDLVKLIDLVQTANNGSSFIENIQQAAEIARKLTTPTRSPEYHPSFVSWLNREVQQEGP